MMKWKKSPESLKALFTEALPDDQRAERRSMFGYPASFANGNMFAGCHQENVVLRLGDEDRAKMLAIPGASVFEPMPGRPMKEYAVVPEGVLEDAKALRAWTAKAFAYALALPPKAKGAKRSAAKKTAVKKPPAPKKKTTAKKRPAKKKR
jgi:TfoX/Sxy family transcriptional regulator of competence genes